MSDLTPEERERLEEERMLKHVAKAKPVKDADKFQVKSSGYQPPKGKSIGLKWCGPEGDTIKSMTINLDKTNRIPLKLIMDTWLVKNVRFRGGIAIKVMFDGYGDLPAPKAEIESNEIVVWADPLTDEEIRTKRESEAKSSNPSNKSAAAARSRAVTTGHVPRAVSDVRKQQPKYEQNLSPIQVAQPVQQQNLASAPKPQTYQQKVQSPASQPRSNHNHNQKPVNSGRAEVSTASVMYHLSNEEKEELEKKEEERLLKQMGIKDQPKVKAQSPPTQPKSQQPAQQPPKAQQSPAPQPKSQPAQQPPKVQQPAQQPAVQSEFKFCPGCGTKLQKAFKFCTNCGDRKSVV